MVSFRAGGSAKADDRAILSGSIIYELGEIKDVAAVASCCAVSSEITSISVFEKDALIRNPNHADAPSITPEISGQKIQVATISPMA